MALARNLPTRKFIPNRSKVIRFWNKYRKFIVISAIALSIILAVYGIFNLTRLAPKDEDKQGLTYETGDQPLPEKVTLWINAKGGLNMREESNATSKILKIIPDGTKLEATELKDGWYKVTYDGKTGWVNEKYVQTYSGTETAATNGWQKYQNTAYTYSLSYPQDWVKVDYGANTASDLVSYVGFGMQLSDEIDPNVLPSIAIKVTKDEKPTVDTNYKAKTNAIASTATVSGVAGTKYVYMASSGVQMTAYVVAGEGYTYILEESGGYADELGNMVKSFKLL